MTHQITASAIRGQKETKTVNGIRELHVALVHYRDRGYTVTRIRRIGWFSRLKMQLQGV